jgi:B12-binding domain/radical SAM domain protein
MRVNWREINASNNSFATLYAACEQAGHRLYTVRSPERDVTCYSLNSTNFPQYTREIASAPCITVLGGPHATACYRELTEIADYVVVGEGERALPDLLSCIERGSGEVPCGVATRDTYRPPSFSVRLDAFPPFSQVKGYIEITRGCPHRCGYCQTPRIFGTSMRHRSIDSIAEWAHRYRDIRLLSPNAFAYGSDGRTPRWEKVELLLRTLRGNIFFGTFPSETRPEFITKNGLDLVTTYCTNTRLAFGGQSGSDRVLSALHRGHSVRDVEMAVELCRDHGLVPVVDFILGLPMEEEEDQRQTLRLIQDIARKGNVRVHRFIPLPGTPLGQSTPRGLMAGAEKVLGRLALKGTLSGSWCGGDTLL